MLDASQHKNALILIPTGDDVLLVIMPAEVGQIPVVRAPRRGHCRHAAVGVKVDVLDVRFLRHRAQSLLLHVELDLCHLGHPKTVAIFTCGEASRSISDAFLTLTLTLTLLDKFLIRGLRAIITIKGINPEVLDLASDKCDRL